MEQGCEVGRDWSPSWHGSPRKVVREEHRV